MYPNTFILQKTILLQSKTYLKETFTVELIKNGANIEGLQTEKCTATHTACCFLVRSSRSYIGWKRI